MEHTISLGNLAESGSFVQAGRISPSDISELFTDAEDVYRVVLGRKTSIYYPDGDDAREAGVYSAYKDFFIERTLRNERTEYGEFHSILGVLVNYPKNRVVVYQGVNASACLNMHIFNASYIQNFTTEITINQLTDILAEAEKLALRVSDSNIARIHRLAAPLTRPAFMELKGEVLTKLSPKIVSTYTANAEEKLKTVYAQHPDSAFKLLSAYTDSVKLRRPGNILEHTLMIESAF